MYSLSPFVHFSSWDISFGNRPYPGSFGPLCGDHIVMFRLPQRSPGGLTRTGSTDFSAQSIEPRPGLFNHRFLMRYSLKGTVKSQKGWRPKVKEAQITGRVVSRSNNWSTSIADFLIVPVVGVGQDKTYFGEQIPFDLKLETDHTNHGLGTESL